MNDSPKAIGVKANTPQGQQWLEQQFAEKGYAEVQLTTGEAVRIYPINPPSSDGLKDETT